MKELDVFKKITIGGMTKEQLLRHLAEAGVQFNPYANRLFEHAQFEPPARPEEVELVKVSLADLGLGNPCSYAEIVHRSSALGLEQCPLFLAAFLRLQYLDQAEGPLLTIASVKPDCSENLPNGFYVRNFENALWLRGYRADDVCEWPPHNEFVFIR